MVGLFRTLQKDWKVRLLEVPTRRRLAVGVQRSAKYGLAAIFYYSGLTGLLLGKLLHAGKRALILGYHGVSDSPPILLSRGHALQNVEALLRFLSRHLPCFPLSRIAGALQNGEAPPPGFAVTFDDGLVNNVLLAIPLLERMGIPATFFVPSGLIGFQQDLWPVQVREIAYAWREAAIPAEAGLWPELPVRDEEGRYVAVHRMKQALKRNQSRRGELLAELARKGQGAPRPPEMDRVVDGDLLRRMVQPGYSVGAHSRTHPILSGINPTEAREEIAGSRRELEQLLGVEVLDFAYPNGRFSDFDQTTRELVAEAGYRCAVTTEPGTVRRGDDPLALRRCMPEDVPTFLASFDLLLRIWKDRRRPADGSRPVGNRTSHLPPPDAEDAA